MQEKWVRFKSFKEKRDNYYVTYHPVSADNNLAVLVVSFFEYLNDEDAVLIIEKELQEWIGKYPTPLMVMPSTELVDFDLNLEKIKGNGFVLGYPDSTGEIISHWDVVPNEAYENFQFQKETLLQMYSGLEYSTSDHAELELRNRVMQNKALIAFTVLCLCAIPSLIAVLGFANPYVSIAALVYSLHKAVITGLELTGKLRPLPGAQEKAEKDRVMAHHHYHCALNPEGFERLKLENFKREREEKNRAKLNELKS